MVGNRACDMITEGHDDGARGRLSAARADRPPTTEVSAAILDAARAIGAIHAEPVGPDARCGSTPDPVGHYLGGWHGAFPAGGPIVSLTPEPSGVEPSLMGVAP